MPKNHIKPNMNSFSDLSGYMGPTRAYLFLKYDKTKKLPEYGLYSDLVVIRSCVYDSLVKLWRAMYDDVVSTKYLQGDQEILCSAVRALDLSYSFFDMEHVKHYHCEKKNQFFKEAKELLGIAFD